MAQRGLLQEPGRSFDIVKAVVERDLAILPHHIACAGIALPRLADAARIDDRRGANLPKERQMGMAEKNEISVGALYPFAQ